MLCLWSAHEDFCINYHRDVQSSRFKRHLCLIAWLSINTSINPLNRGCPLWAHSVFPVPPPSVPHLHLYITLIARALNSKAQKVQEKICYHQSWTQMRRASCLEQLSLLNITGYNQNPWMQILFSRPLNKKELAFQRGSIDAGVSKALTHVCSLMMKVRKEPVTERACTLFGKVVTMTFSNSFRHTRILQHAGSVMAKDKL